MALAAHIIIALLSVAYTTYLLVRPSRSGFLVNYGLITLTLVSGTYLVWNTGAHIIQSCVTGLVYIVGVSLGTIAARKRLAAAENTQ